ncbi:uncharacterized protein Z518_02231 [Rhinocladiella mackenziei CBS 650.93]|uniref:Uncharacterized protein n=1 Tax=Rhinocladiella mackenziei CBS 650.93 TaxID=1442369 RepID=A0A0D2HAW2_9EURO|nr:uncharacterized protein Z518_02231 [Rhinocladiella mackenziei CBS 650.93]KIX07578.1 hypothetical protein Z518_02231 [Rhinocladiella mackenziei CBS 650.93]
MAYKQFRRRARPAEPRDCPQHRTVQKSFLNQICEDCLLAELDAEPLALEKTATALSGPTHASENGEGLIWDSEVKVEIQSQPSEQPNSPATSDAFVYDNDSQSDHSGILESQTEVKAEVDSNNVSAEDVSSPLFPASHQGASSGSSSVATSPSAHIVAKGRPTSPGRRNKRYGLTFQDTVISDVGDADDEFDNGPSHKDPSSSPYFRGRTLTRGNYNSFERCGSSPNTEPTLVGGKNSIHVLSKFKSLRLISSSLRPSSSSRDQDKSIDAESPPGLTTSSTSAGPKSRNPFRAIRTRKCSPPVVETVESRQGLIQVSFGNDDHNLSTNTESNPISQIPPRKSNLKAWARFLRRGRRRGYSQLPRQLTSLASNPTGSWSHNRFEYHEEVDSLVLGSTSHSHSAFDTGSGIKSLEIEGRKGVESETEISSTTAILNIPESSTMNTLPATIGTSKELDFGLGIENGGKLAQQQQESLEDKSMQEQAVAASAAKIEHLSLEPDEIALPSSPIPPENQAQVKTRIDVSTRPQSPTALTARCATNEPTNFTVADKADGRERVSMPQLGPIQTVPKDMSHPPRSSSLKSLADSLEVSERVSRRDEILPVNISTPLSQVA